MPPLATLKRRFASLLYESLAVFSILLIGFLIPQTVIAGFGGTTPPPRILWLHVFVLLLVYFVWCWLNGGQTLSMKTWKLRVISDDGRPLRPLQAILRYLAAWPSTLLFGVGFFWAIIDRDHQFLHDRIAGTRVVADL